MTRNAMTDLRTNVLVGDVTKNGRPWQHWNTDTVVTDDNTTPLYGGAVPVAHVRDLFDSFTVESLPLSFVREYREGDKERDDVQTFSPRPGVRMSIVTDYTRQIVADSSNDRVHFVPKDGYEIHHFGETLIDNLAHIVGDSAGDIHIDSAGILAKGGEGWVSLSTSQLMSTPEGVDYYPHILAASSHNGTLSSTYCAVNTMTVCDNTRDMALSEGRANGTRTKIRHTKYSAAKLADARAALGLIEAASDDFAASVKALCETHVTDSQWSAFVQELAPITNDSTKNAVTRAESMRESLSTLYNGDPRVEPWRGTAFGALQAVNTFDLWNRGTRGDTDPAARIVREAITGTLSTREADRADTLARVLVTV